MSHVGYKKEKAKFKKQLRQLGELPEGSPQRKNIERNLIRKLEGQRHE